MIKDGADVRFHQISIIPFVPLIHLKRVSAGSDRALRMHIPDRVKRA